MAGIGFTLRRLARKDDILGLLSAFTHSALASTGPWLFTVIALAGVAMLQLKMDGPLDFVNFRIVIIYNFAFSLVFAAPIYMVATRCLADSLHNRNVASAPGMLLGCLMLGYTYQLPIVAWFYLMYVDLPTSVQLSAIANFFLISSIWVIAVFLTALKDYMAVTRAFGIGMILAIIGAAALVDQYGTAGMINGFSIGIAFIMFSMFANVMCEYNYKPREPFGFLSFFKEYWELAAGGFFYSVAIWVDKWIMWFAPEAEVLPSHMRQYPNYDSAMFLAFLTIVPSMAVFVFSVETNFFERYLKFYRDILNHANMKQIKKNQQGILDSIFSSARNFIVLQGTISFISIVLAASVFAWFNINYLQIGIFRIGVLAVFFHALALFLTIIMSYFDCRRLAMLVQGFFMVTNALFTYLTLDLGFPYYGYGYFVSSVLTFVIAAVLAFRHIRDLPYHAFITNNYSVINKVVRT